MARSHAVYLIPGRFRTVGGFPFGRLQISAEGIRLYARLIPGVPSYELARPDIVRVVLTRGWGGRVVMRIEDRAGLARQVKVRLMLPSGKIRRELIALEYPVVTHDKWLAWRNPWQKKGWSAPPADR